MSFDRASLTSFTKVHAVGAVNPVILETSLPQLLKIIGDTNQRRSRLMGLENVQISISKSDGNAQYDVEAAQRQTAAKLGVNVGALKEMGNFLATKINALPDPKDDDGNSGED